MALGTSINASFTAAAGQVPSLPMSISGPWSSSILTDLSVVDAATLTNPTTQITASSRRTIYRRNVGTSLMLQVLYPRAATVLTTSPTLVVFGRTVASDGTVGDWNILTNVLGEIGIVVELDPTNDADDGATYKRSTVQATQWIDCQGYDEFIVGCSSAAVLDVSAATAYVRARFV